MPVGFQVGPLFIRFYGIILMLGAVAAAFVAEREVRRRGMNGDLVWDALIWLLIGGIIGARLWHVFTPPPSMVERGITVQFYLTHPLDILNTTKGGLGFPGRGHRGPAGVILVLPPEEAQLPGVGGYCRPGAGVGPGDRALGELRQPGTVRRAYQPALEDIYRPAEPPAGLRGCGLLPPAFPV